MPANQSPMLPAAPSDRLAEPSHILDEYEPLGIDFIVDGEGLFSVFSQPTIYSFRRFTQRARIQ